jgi:hypothetical protein
VEWIDLAPDREKLGAVVDTVVNKVIIHNNTVLLTSTCFGATPPSAGSVYSNI